jgi:hypothetical protein
MVERLRERVDIIGWRYESYSEQVDTWTTEITLDSDRTAAELRNQNGHIRNLTPLVQFDDVATTLDDVVQTDGSNTTASNRLNTDEEIAHRKRALASVRSGHANHMGDDNE